MTKWLVSINSSQSTKKMYHNKAPNANKMGNGKNWGGEKIKQNQRQGNGGKGAKEKVSRYFAHAFDPARAPNYDHP